MSCNHLPFISTCVTYTLCYYTYVVEFVFYSVCHYDTQLALLFIFHILYATSFTLFITTACDRGWMVPEKYKIPDDLFEKLRKAYIHEEDDLLAAMCLERNIHVRMRTKDGVKRVCYRCRHIKPDRAYHCRKCMKCVCRMDHHCYFLKNCIARSNMKYFIYLNVYTGIMSLYCAVTEICYIVEMVITGHDVGMRISLIIVSAIVSFMVGFTCFALAILSLYTIGRNTSVVELKHSPIFQSNVRVTYDKGCRRNFEEHCGSNMCFWCLPCTFDNFNDVEVKKVTPRIYYKPKNEETYLEEELKNKQQVFFHKM